MTLRRIFYIPATAALLIGILIIGQNVLMPLAIALFLWLLINGMADAFRERLHCPAVLDKCAAIISLVLLAGVPIMLASDTVPQVVEAAPRYQANIEAMISQLFRMLGLEQGPTLQALRHQIDLTTMAGSVAAGFASFGGSFILILLYVAFLLLEQGGFNTKLDAMFADDKREERVRRMLNDMYLKIQRYLWVKSLVSLLTGAVSFVLLAAVGVDFAAFWAVMIFFLNFIPNIGSILGVVFPALLTLVQFDTLYPFLMVALGGGLIQFMVGNVIEPRLMGSSLNLSPFVIILALVVWGSIWGLVGAFLSVPIMVILMIVFAEIPQTKALAIMLSANGRVDGSTNSA